MTNTPLVQVSAREFLGQASQFSLFMAQTLTPADPSYWDDFYIDGDGKGNIYEWYTSYEVRVQGHIRAPQNCPL